MCTYRVRLFTLILKLIAIVYVRVHVYIFRGNEANDDAADRLCFVL